MKKTIAILLVLVIGMVGVFAATADLLLTTTVFEVNQMSIIEPDGTTPWTDFENAAAIATATSSYSTTRQTVDPYITTPQYIADVHTRTNNRQGYTVSIQATQLISSEIVGENPADVEKINYTIYNDNGTTAIYTTADTLPASATFMSDDGTTKGLRATEKPVYVKLLTTKDNLNAGTYEGAITFTYTAP
jgi:hypothetical protein